MQLFFTILICIIFVALGIRAYDITARSLWFDEAFSWRLIQFPFGEMIARDAQDVHPPLYYVLLKGWSVVFGTSLLALRLFSVACAGVSLVGAYLFSAYAFRSRMVGFVAVLLLAVSGWNISYAWEARMYTLGMALAFFSSYALLRAVRTSKLIWFILYGLLAVAFAYVHYFAFFTIAAQAIFVLGHLLANTRGRIGEILHSRIFWYSCLSAILAGLIYLPWLPTFLHQRSQVQASYWVPPLASTSVPDTFYQFFVPTKGIPPHRGLILFASLLPITGVLVLWTWLAVRRSKNRDAAIFTLLLGAVPFFIGIAISFFGRSLYNDRFFAFAGIFIFIALAYGLCSIPKKAIRIVAIALVAVGLSFGFFRYWNELDIAHKAGAHGATQYIFQNRSEESHILVSSPYVYFAIQYYATEEFHDGAAVTLFSKSGELSHFSGAPIATQSDVSGPAFVVGLTGTAWVVDTTGYTEKAFEAPKNWKEIQRRTFPEVFVHQGDIVVREFQIL